MKHYTIKIYGRVQGVFFRKSAREMAEKLNLSGYAKNEPDHTLFIEVEGEEEKLDEFLKWCNDGPELARVEKLRVMEADLKNFKGFELI
ncbi:MAG: acylphosphatase [Patescibacteria group bacterium]